EAHGVPEGVEQAGAAVEFAQAGFAPGEVVAFFLGGLFHAVADLGKVGGEGLALVEGLGADFAGVVDAHEAGAVAGGGKVQVRVRLGVGGVGALFGGAAGGEGA